jgi:hypothetical protein
MRNFYTKNTVEAPNWCRKCGRETQWKIDDGRPTYCMVCHDKYEPPKEPEKQPEQGDLF